MIYYHIATRHTFTCEMCVHCHRSARRAVVRSTNQLDWSALWSVSRSTNKTANMRFQSIQRPPVGGNKGRRLLPRFTSLIRVFKPDRQLRSQPCSIANPHQSARFAQRIGNALEVETVWPHHHRQAQCCRLQRIMSAGTAEAAAYKGDIRRRVEQHQLAHAVTQIQIGVFVRLLATAAPYQSLAIATA